MSLAKGKNECNRERLEQERPGLQKLRQEDVATARSQQAGRQAPHPGKGQGPFNHAACHESPSVGPSACPRKRNKY